MQLGAQCAGHGMGDVVTGKRPSSLAAMVRQLDFERRSRMRGAARLSTWKAGDSIIVMVRHENRPEI